MINDSNLQSALGITDISNMLICNKKVRTQAADPTLLSMTDPIDPSDPSSPLVLPFVDMSFIPTHGQQKNYLTNKGTLEFNIYCSYISEAEVIYKAIKVILENNYEDLQVTYSGQGGCPIADIYRYIFRVRPLTSS